MNNINALIERLFDWRSTASRREFLNIFLAICGVGLLLSIPYIYLIAEFIGLVVDYGEDAAGMMFESMLTAKIVLGLCLWTCFFFFLRPNNPSHRSDYLCKASQRHKRRKGVGDIEFLSANQSASLDLLGVSSPPPLQVLKPLPQFMEKDRAA